MSELPPLPPGFVLDSTGPSAQSLPPLPPGFVLDGAPSPPPATGKPYSGTILPFTKDAQGNVSFDSNAGLVGIAKRLPGQLWDAAQDAFTLPRDIIEGTAPDPNSQAGLARALNFAAIGTPLNPAVRAGGLAVPVARKVIEPGEVTRTAPLQTAAVGTEVGPYSPQGARPAAPVGTVELRNPDTVRYDPVLRRSAPPPPTVEELKQAGGAGYDQARATGVTYAAPSVGDLAQSVKAALTREGRVTGTAPVTHGVLDEISAQASKPGVTASISDVDAIRQAFGHVAQSGATAAERRAGKIARTAIEDFLERPPQEAVLAGPAAEAGRLVTEARGNIAAAKRSEQVTGTQNTARLQAAGISDAEIEALRQVKSPAGSIQKRAADLLLDPRKNAGFSAEELQALKGVAEGSRATKSLRAVGKLLGGKSDIGRTIAAAAGSGLGYAVGGPAGAGLGATALPIIGAMSRMGSEALSRRAMLSADDLVRLRSPLAENRAAMGPAAAVPGSTALALRLGLLGLAAPGDPRLRNLP
jgi:hypothetical protein